MWSYRLFLFSLASIAFSAKLGNAQSTFAQFRSQQQPQAQQPQRPQQPQAQQQTQQPQQQVQQQPQAQWNSQQTQATAQQPAVQFNPTTESPQTAPTPSPIDCHIREDGTYLPEEQPCSQIYYICSHGVSRYQFCPRGLFFDAETGACNFRDEVDDCNHGFTKLTPRPTRHPSTDAPQPTAIETQEQETSDSTAQDQPQSSQVQQDSSATEKPNEQSTRKYTKKPEQSNQETTDAPQWNSNATTAVVNDQDNSNSTGPAPHKPKHYNNSTHHHVPKPSHDN
ncbi:hypothetical protein M3Y94_00901200 [Aphelenchoides besseyi]|nr:hypothetical protein M3Y94_00901200 [Aphelenchoides besseyi]KAI6223350.1 hypothetical protein M3Y95_00880900 [Aphelenchoides besseyi]